MKVEKLLFSVIVIALTNFGAGFISMSGISFTRRLYRSWRRASRPSRQATRRRRRPRARPIPLVPGEATWDSFHGQLNAQKYSPLDQINADNVGELKKVWEVHTGDVSDGHGDLPPTVWSATPVFANDTFYIGTPFYRILALDPATGEEKWSFDTQSTLEAFRRDARAKRHG